MLLANNKYNVTNIVGEKSTTLQNEINSCDIINGSTQNNMFIRSEIFFPDFIKNSYKVIEAIGQGGFGVVYSAISNVDNSKVAIKVMAKEKLKKEQLVFDEVYTKYIPKEAYLLRRLNNHPNFIKFIELFEAKDEFYMVTEIFGKKWDVTGENQSRDLFECMENTNLSEHHIKHITKQIVRSLIYLKKLNLYHSDIKDENILVDENYNIKLIDFGSCQQILPGVKVDSFKGTIDYASPEILLKTQYYPELADVWALGYLIHMMVYGKQPFLNVNDIFVRKYKAQKSRSVSNQCRILLNKMLNNNPCKRVGFDYVKKHPWLN